MCCTRLAGNTGRKNYVKKLPSAHHRTTFWSYVFATEAYIDNPKKLVKQQSSTCPYNMANFRPLMAEISLGVWGTQKISMGFTS